LFRLYCCSSRIVQTGARFSIGLSRSYSRNIFNDDL